MEQSMKNSLVDVINERIKTFIVDNNMKSGDKLPSEKELTDRLEVSRTVVREALKSLQMMGIIQRKSGGGIIVSDPSLKNVVDHISFQWKGNKAKMAELLETRKILEFGAIETAILHYNADLIDSMQRWNDKIEAKLHVSSIQTADKEDWEFHRALFKATGNTTYYQLCDILNDFFRFLRPDQLSIKSDIQKAVSEHQAIIDCIRAKNVEAAKTNMLLHLSHLSSYIT